MSSVEELLPLLPQQLRDNFTFVFESRSPFKDSINHEYPRVVMFSKDTRFILTFTGQPGKPGYDIIEMIDFKDKTASFEFYAYDLKLPNRYNKDLTSQSCQECHGKDSRPINDSYPLWVGFYGAVLDSFPNVESSQKEKAGYDRFLSANAKKGVYKYLNFKKGSSVPPYLEPSLLKLDDQKRATTLNTDFKPNERFGIALTALNRKRIFRKVKESANYESSKKDILYELLDCGKSKVKTERINKVYQRVVDENKARLKRMKTAAKDMNNELIQMQELKMVHPLAELDWVGEKLGVSMSDWSLAQEKDSLSFFDGILSGHFEDKNFYIKEDLIFEMLQDLASSESKYKDYFKVGYNLGAYQLPFIDKLDIKQAVKSCRQLKKDKLKRALSNISN
ncbi:MAG: hypothetical protein HRT44_02980 [Bdellovibrionales bacterium]|nr:hypothetical protein [Bdellovibrionales bacterium]